MNLPFYRNIRAREHLDIFLIAAAASVLLIRAFLHLADYPQIGGDDLHIAHMLWGGLLMATGIVVSVAFIGLHAQRISALVGGIGFGVFIDELGKFITSDNDYFYRPAIGLIYAIFVILYLTFNFLSRTQKYSSKEYQLNALTQLEEAILHDLDIHEKRRAQELLSKADHRSPITQHLEQIINSVALVPESPPNWFRRQLTRLDLFYTNQWRKRSTRRAVRAFFVIETIVFVLAVMYGIYNNISDITTVLAGDVSYDFWLYIGQFISSAVAAGFAIEGAFLLTRSRMKAFEMFRRATMINLLLTQFFIFSRIEFEALAGFFFNLAILFFIIYVLHQEERLSDARSQK